MLESVRRTLALLDPRSRRVLWLLVVVQVTLAFLDMFGVLLFGLVAALSASAISGGEPVFIGELLENLGIEQENEISLAVSLAIFAGFVFVVKSVTSFFLIRRSYRFLANRQAIISSRLASQLLSRPLLDVQRRSSQQTAYALVQGVNAATIGVLGSSVVIASELAVLLVLTIGLIVVDVIVAIFTVIFFSLVAGISYRVIGNWARRLGRQLSSTEIASITSAQNSIRTYREIFVTGRRGILLQEFEQLRWQAASVQANIQIMTQVSKYIFEIALILGAGMLAVSQFLTRDVVAAIAVIAVFLAAASRIMPALLRLQAAVLGVRTASGVSTPTLEIADEFGQSRDVEFGNPELRQRVIEGSRQGYTDFTPEIEVTNVTLMYPDTEAPAVNEVSLRVAAGESLALVGPTGAGKSTLADLILGVLVPDEGRVSVSGIDPGAAATRWPGAISYVPQEIVVLEGSVRDNVALGLPRDVVDDYLVMRALEHAHLDTTVKQERDGLDTVVGENGVRLSGGQRQRLGLARALYTQPKLIVLDEATSALDAETEDSIASALAELDGEVTLVIVAHRLATIRNCTAVAYMEGGVVQVSGTFEDVRKRAPNFDRQAHLLGL